MRSTQYTRWYDWQAVGYNADYRQICAELPHTEYPKAYELHYEVKFESLQ